MSCRKALGAVVELDSDTVPASRLERLWMLMALTMAEIEEPIADPRRRAVRCDIGQPHCHQPLSPIRRKLELDDGRPKDLQAFSERIRVEIQRVAIILTLIARQIRNDHLGVPAPAVPADGLRRLDAQRDDVSRGGLEPIAIEGVAPLPDTRRRPIRLRHPATRQRRISGGRGYAVLHPDAQHRAIERAVVHAL